MDMARDFVQFFNLNSVTLLNFTQPLVEAHVLWLFYVVISSDWLSEMGHILCTTLKCHIAIYCSVISSTEYVIAQWLQNGLRLHVV